MTPDYDTNACRRLISATLLAAVKDAASHTASVRAAAIAWMSTCEANEMAQAIGLNVWPPTRGVLNEYRAKLQNAEWRMR
jgi:hypothetical protein